MNSKPYSFDDHPEHRARLDEWRDMWIANAMSTAPMSDAEKDAACKAVVGLYRAAKLAPPPEHRIVFVSSPIVAAFAAGFASMVWHRRKHATDAATAAAIDAATYAATYDATRDATAAATRWYRGVGDMRRVASFFGDPSALLLAAQNAWRMRNGGNQWSAWASYLSFFRHVAGIDTAATWDDYETLARMSGPRYMHAEFCIVSDRPEVLKVDDRNRPHCDDGPFCRWRDGVELYAVRGVRVPAWIVRHPETITVEAIKREINAEVRRVMLERFGYGRYFVETKATVVDYDHETCEVGAAPRALMRDGYGDQYLVCTDGSTRRVYTLRVPATVTTCRAAHEALCGFPESTIRSKS